MYRFLILATLMFGSLFAQSGFIRPYKSTLLTASAKEGTLKIDRSVKKGASGVVIRHFDKTHYAIIAKAIVTRIEGDTATLSFGKFDLLTQKALPDYNIAPKAGDTVLLNYLYNRAMAITPDKTNYDAITSRYPDIDWVHPDLLAIRLSTDFNAKPTRDDFRKSCKMNDFALLFFAIGDRGYFVDCNSFQTLQKVPMKRTSRATLPFYSRLGTIKGRLGALLGGIKDYDRYYSRLLGVE